MRGRKRLQAVLQRGAGDVRASIASDLPRWRALLRAPALRCVRDPQHAFAALDQEPFQRPGDVSAVLKRPHALAVEGARPPHRLANPRRPTAMVCSPRSSPLPAATAAIACERM
jgi:hypothetical protein